MPFLLSKEDFFIPPKRLVSIIRVLPSWTKAHNVEFYKKVLTHYDVSPSCRALICEKMALRPCRLCALSHSLSETPGKITQGVRMTVTLRYMVNVYHVRLGAFRIWSISNTTLARILKLVIECAPRNILDVNEGSNLRLVTSTMDGYADYRLDAMKPSPLEIPDWHRRLYDLDKFFKAPSVQEVDEVLQTIVKK